MERLVQLSELLQGSNDELVGAMYFSMPASIVSYDPATSLAVVQPTLADVRYNPDTEVQFYEAWPQITCRVMWPSFGGMVLAGNLDPFDTVTLIAWDRDPSDIAGPGNLPTNPTNVAKFTGHSWRAIPEALLPLLAVDSTAAATNLILGVRGGLQMQIAKDGSKFSVVKAPVVALGDATTLTASLGGPATTSVALGPGTDPLALAPPVVAAWAGLGAYTEALTVWATAVLAAPPVTPPQVIVALVALATALEAAGGPVAGVLATAGTATAAVVVKGA